jgi:hypothetical protein
MVVSIVSLTAAATDWAHKRGCAHKAQRERATRVSWLGAITEESRCSNMHAGGRGACGYNWDGAFRSEQPWGLRRGGVLGVCGGRVRRRGERAW